MSRRRDELVKSCRKLEAGLRLGPEGVRACQLGQFAAPLYWSEAEAATTVITKKMIMEKRRGLFQQLNSDGADIPCKHCHMVTERPYADVDFSRIGHIDLAASTTCNLRCSFCGYTKRDTFHEAKYDALAILREFAPEDSLWDAAVDFNGGEPTLLPNCDDFIDYFRSRRIRVFLYTNAVKFSQAVADGLASGAIRWVCTSLDAGTPSTFHRLKRSDVFPRAVETLARYAQAGSGSGGKLAVKYIFCEDNCGEDDVVGFSYLMLAIRPQEVWLTFDFEPLIDLPSGTQDLGSLDYSSQVRAYARTYELLDKHGIQAVHFTEKHLGNVSPQGRLLLEMARGSIRKLETGRKPSDGLYLGDFRNGEQEPLADHVGFACRPLRVFGRAGEASWDLKGRRILIAPACALSVPLLKDPEVLSGEIVGILDRDPVLQGKRVEGFPVHGYEAIGSLAADVILVAAPSHHRQAILGSIRRHMSGGEQVALWKEDRDE